MEVTIPLAFQAVATSPAHAEKEVRRLCREKFREVRLLDRIVPDIDVLLQVGAANRGEMTADYDDDPALPAPLWDGPEEGE